MNTEDKTARIYGVLLICGILFGIINSIPELESPDYLTILRQSKHD